MPISTQLQAQIDAIQTRIDTLAPSATPEDIVMLAKAVEAVGGQATVFDVIDTGQQQKAELIATADLKSAEVVATGDAQVDRVSQQGDLKFNELSQEVQRYAAFGGATPSAMGSLGMVPAPKAGQQARILKGSGTWDVSGEVPVGGIVLGRRHYMPPSFLLCDGATVKQSDYPALYAAIGSHFGSTDFSHGNQAFSSISAYGNYNCIASNGNRVISVPTDAVIRYSANGGASWNSSATVSNKNSNSILPVISDEGSAVGWFAYDGTNGRYLFQWAAGSFGSWTTSYTFGTVFHASYYQNLFAQGVPGGIAFVGQDNGTTGNPAVFGFIANNASAATRTVVLTNVDARFIRCKAMLRVGAKLFLLVDDAANGERFILSTADNGATWTTVFTATGNWSSQATYFWQPDRRQSGAFAFALGDGALIFGGHNLRVQSDGTVQSFTLPSGASPLGHLTDYYGGEYVIPCSDRVLATTDFVTFTVKATISAISAGKATAISSAYMSPSNGAWVFYGGDKEFYWTSGFDAFKRLNKPSRWYDHASHSIQPFPGKEFMQLNVRQHGSSSYWSSGVIDLTKGVLSSNGYWQDFSSYSYNLYWSFPLPGADHYMYETYSSSYYHLVRGVSTYYAFNRDTEFRLPKSSSSASQMPNLVYDGEYESSFNNSDLWRYSGMQFFVRAQ